MPNASAEIQFKLGTFSNGSVHSFGGIVLRDRVLPFERLSPIIARMGHPVGSMDSLAALLRDWPSSFPAIKQALQSISHDQFIADTIELGSLTVHAPFIPGNMYCSAANYKKHMVELIVEQGGDPSVEKLNPEQRRKAAVQMIEKRAAIGEPYFFVKPTSTIAGPYEEIKLPRGAQQPDWELELGIVIGRRARCVSHKDAFEYVAGYTIVNDITNRDWNFRKDFPGADWLSGKGSPTYSPVGPYLVPSAFVKNPQDLKMTLKLNGETMQDERTSDMVLAISKLIEYLSGRVQLMPGDLVATGSPLGNGTKYNRFLRPGDVLEASIEELGTQRNTCALE